MVLPDFGKIILIRTTIADFLFKKLQVAEILGHKNKNKALKKTFKGKPLKKYKPYKKEKKFKLLIKSEPLPNTILLTEKQVLFFLKIKKINC